MGKRLQQRSFAAPDFEEFVQRLQQETQLLTDWALAGDISDEGGEWF